MPVRPARPPALRATLQAESLEGRALPSGTDPAGLAGTIAQPTAPSPTGRSPAIGWTAEQQAVWNRMRADNHPWYRLAIDGANRTGTPNERYLDVGNWATLAYQMTGDAGYVGKAWAKIKPVITAEPQNANQVRQYFMQYAQFYDWLSPGLTAGQKAEYAAGLNRWAEWSLGINTRQWVGGFRTADSDQTIGQYFGLAFTDIALGTSWLGETARNHPGTPVGGLDATGPGFGTARNAVGQYARLAAGGEFVESTEYNLGTLRLLVAGVHGVRTATGVDHFPEVTAILPNVARAQLYALTPDLRDAYQWGDTEQPNDLELHYRAPLLGTLAAATRGDPAVGPYAQRAFNDLLARHGATGYLSAAPIDTLGFGQLDPYAPAADWRGAMAPGFNDPGQGLTLFRDGWAADGGLFAAHFAGRVRVDHEVSGFGDFRLYRRGEWAVDHPLGYSGPAVTGEAMNSLLIAGLSSAADRRQVAAESGAGGEYAYAAGTTGGSYYDLPYWDAPPTAIREWTRSLFYLPAADGSSSTVVAYDRVDASDPRTLPKFDRYRAADRAEVESSTALVDWTIHTPVAPTVTPAGLAWATAGGQRVQVDALTPGPRTTAVVRTADLWAGTVGNFRADQMTGYQARVSPDSDAPWQTLLNVVQVSGPGAGLRNTRVASPGGQAEGVLVERAGQPDALVLFGAARGQRVMADGYAATWVGGAGRTDAYLLDLDPSKAWTVTVDGGAARPLTVSSQGVGRLSLSGAGGHTLWLTSSDAPPPVVPPPPAAPPPAAPPVVPPPAAPPVVVSPPPVAPPPVAPPPPVASPVVPPPVVPPPPAVVAPPVAVSPPPAPAPVVPPVVPPPPPVAPPVAALPPVVITPAPVVVTPAPAPVVAPVAETPAPAETVLSPRVVVGGGGGAVVFAPDAGGRYAVNAAAAVNPFPGFAGAVRSAQADVDGDGVADTVLVTGPGTAIRLSVVSGRDNRTVLVPPTAPFAGSEGFTGGGFVASADLDGDGVAEWVVTPDEGGGPRVTVFSLAGGRLATRANFFGIDDASFRGGARAAVGDVNGDGVADLAVAAGFLGGPRAAVFDGKTLLNDRPARLVGDFFAFPGADAETLRNGVFVAVGDLDGDGYGDLIFGGGPGGAARVYALSGQRVAAGDVAGAQADPVANFFVAGGAGDRGGVRVGAADADGDGRADLLAGSGAGSPARVRVYLGKDFAGAGEPAAYQDLAPFGGAALPDGVYVG